MTTQLPAHLDLVDGEDAAGVTQLFALRVGHDYSIEVEFLLADGVTPEDLTARSFEMDVRPASNSSEVALRCSPTDTLGIGGVASLYAPVPENGRLVFSLPALKTKTLHPGQYVYALVETTSGGRSGMCEGKFDFVYGVAR